MEIISLRTRGSPKLSPPRGAVRYAIRKAAFCHRCRAAAEAYPHPQRGHSGSCPRRSSAGCGAELSCATQAAAPAPERGAAMGWQWGQWLLPLGLLQALGGPAGGACPCQDPRLCHPVTGTGGFEVRVPRRLGPGCAAGWGKRCGAGVALPAGRAGRARGGLRGQQRVGHVAPCVSGPP